MRNLLVLLFLFIATNTFAAQIDARFMTTGFNSLFSGKTTDGLTQGSTNLYWSSSLFNTAFSGKTTDSLAQGSSNLYWSATLFNTAFSGKTTDALSEGSSNKYYHLSTVQSDLLTGSVTSGDTTHALTSGAAFTALGAKIDSSLIGAANGIAPLDASSKIDVSYLPNAIMFYKGNWTPGTNSPALADGTGTAGWVYRASAAGTANLGSGSHTWQIGDFVIYNGTVWQYAPASTGVVSVNGLQGAVTLGTDQVAQGSTNFYFSNALARAALSATAPILYNSASGTLTAQYVSSSQDGVLSASQYNALTAVSINPDKETLTLSSGDISAGYKDMTVLCKSGTLNLIVKGASAVAEGADYSTSNVSSKTRITFAGDLASGGATPLIAGDVLYTQCLQ